MKRLLCILSCMNAGGAETFLMKIYRTIDRERFQMDFCLVARENYYAAEIEQLGGKIYYISMKSKHPIASFRDIKKIVKLNKYDYVMRVNEHSLATLDLLAARLGGARHIIMRSSNTSTPDYRVALLHKMFHFLTNIIPNIRLAPSTEAAEYTFGKGCVQNGSAIILKNAIDIEYYRYNNTERKKIRDELGLTNKFVIGHIGRFNTQKNHSFLIKVFKEVLKKRSEAVLLLVGEGNLESAIKCEAKEIGVFDKIIFAGVRKDIPSVLSAMDVFVFPSFYEGMPNAVIEAQANGLHCIISDSITKEVDITDLVCYLPLSVSCSIWADKILTVCCEHLDTNEKMLSAGYSIEDVTQKFIRMVFET